MKVAHICTMAGSHKILIDKLELLEKKGYEVDLISSTEMFNPELTKNSNVNIKFIEMKRNISIIEDFKSIINMRKLLKKEKYDIVHTHNAKAGLIGRIASKMARVPLILHTSHGLPFYKGQSFFRYNLYKSLERLGSTFCDVLLSQNHEDIKNLKDLTNKRPVYYEGNGVDVNKLLSIYKSYENTTQETKDKYELNEKYVFLMGARFTRIKDHDFLIEGVKSLVDNYTTKPFIVLLAGQGDLEDKIIQKITNYGLNDYIKIIGHQKEIYKFISVTDSVILTSRKEGIPRIIMEAMTAKKLVIGTDVLGTKELVRDKDTGLLVKYRDISELAKKMNDAITLDNKKVCINGYNHIINNFSEELVVERLDRIYSNELLN